MKIGNGDRSGVSGQAIQFRLVAARSIARNSAFAPNCIAIAFCKEVRVADSVFLRRIWPRPGVGFV
jgi:hypothetical protein